MLLVLRRLRHSDHSNLKMTHVSRAPDYCTAIPGGQEDRNPQNVSKFTIVNTYMGHTIILKFLSSFDKLQLKLDQ